MKKVFKKINKKFIFGFILGALIFGTIGVSAATYYASKDVSYDNASSGMSSDNVQDAIDELYQIANTKPAIDKVTELVSTNTNELYTDEHGDIRYYGSNPNNYVTFNNELWRIIGVIDGKIKIIRSESIGDMEWASNGNNNWNNASLKSYLNGEYYNSIDETYKNMISEETYYLSSVEVYSAFTASEYYTAERSNTTYNGNPTSTKQKIGLMYPSDYGYAAGNHCLSTTLINYSSSCKNSDYLSIGVTEWLQLPGYGSSGGSPFSLDNDVYASRTTAVDAATALRSDGEVDHGLVPYSNAVRPSLYLNTNVKITGGDGSQSSPFLLG